MILRKRFLIPFLLVVFTFIYFYKNPEQIFYVQKLFGIAPCQKPITYQIENLDSKFNLSKENLKKYLEQAELIWEKPLGINLFEYSPEGKIKISLIYDYRQATTNNLNDVNKTITSSKQEYQNLKTEYENLKSSYEIKNNNYNSFLSDFEKRKALFEQQIKTWNKKGGAPQNIYTELEKEKQELQNDIDKMNSMTYELNNMITTLNQKATELNQIAKNLNLSVDIYNNIAEKTPREFNEGIYEKSVYGESIKIYQFENKTKLIRVLAHEFGHALNLDHIDEKESIMYELNTSNNMTPTKTEVEQLKKICHVN